MKQKYMILKGEDKKNIVIQEFAELDKDTLSLLCEETYDMKIIRSAVSKGKEAEKIADSVIALFKSKDQDSLEVYFDDFDLITTKKVKNVVEKTEEEAAEIDELIEEDDDMFF